MRELDRVQTEKYALVKKIRFTPDVLTKLNARNIGIIFEVKFLYSEDYRSTHDVINIRRQRN